MIYVNSSKSKLFDIVSKLALMIPYSSHNPEYFACSNNKPNLNDSVEVLIANDIFGVKIYILLFRLQLSFALFLEY